MSAQYFRLSGTSFAVFSKFALTLERDLNIGAESGNRCFFKGDSGTLKLTKNNYVFNVGAAQNATGVVEKIGGDWDCHYLRLGNGSESAGTFTMNGGTLHVRTQLGIGYGANSSGSFYLNGGTVKTKLVLAANTASSLLVINGGTLQADGTSGAWVEAPVDIRIGANGGTFHTDGGDVTILSAVNSAADTSGSLTVTGGGSARFAAGGDITSLVVDEDTELRWLDADATVSAYTLDSLDLGAGSTFALDVDASGCDTFSAASTRISSAADKKVTFKLVVRAMPESGRAFPLLAMDEAEAVNYDVVAVTPAGAPLTVEKGWADGSLTYAIYAKDYVWGGGANGGGWRNEGAMWLVDGVTSEWSDNNNAVFATAGDVATLDADVTAVALDFRASATINPDANSELSISVPEVAVAPGVSATVNAPLSSAFTKIGAGTLVLGTNCIKHTTLEEGTLTIASATPLDWTQFTIGTDPVKPVTFSIGPDATITNTSSPWYIGTVDGVTSSVVKTGGDWTNSFLFIACAEASDTTFIHEDGTMTLTHTVDLGRGDAFTRAHFDISGGTVFHSGYIHMGVSSPAVMTIRADAKYEMTSSHSHGLIAGGNSDATLNIAGGEALVMGPLNIAYYGDSGPHGVVNVTEGGVLACDRIAVNAKSSGGTGRLTFDGGTLRANADNTAFIPARDNLTVTVGENSGTIDANGKIITIAKAISGTGGMAFKEGGKITFTVDNTYTGMTSVEIGTTVVVPTIASIAGGLAVTAPGTPLADGVYTILALSGSDTFPADVLAGIVPPERGRLVLSGDGKFILCIVGNPGFAWIGGISGNLNEASNWADNSVPQRGDICIISTPIAADLTVGDTFAPSSIVFPANSACVTLSGESALSGLSSVVNDSAQHHVFACPVDVSAGTPELPLDSANYLVFSGGISLTEMPSVESMCLAGVWNLTGDWDMSECGAVIKSGSTVNVSETLLNGCNLAIEENAALRVKNAVVDKDEANASRFLADNSGTFIVDDEMRDEIRSDTTASYNIVGFFGTGGAGAVTRVNGIVHDGSSQGQHQLRLNNSNDSITNVVVLGSGGLSFGENLSSNADCYPYFTIVSRKTVVLASSADWSLGMNSVPGKDLCLELAGAVIIDTSDYDNRTVGHTVRSLGRIGSGGTVTVKGCGTFVFDHSSDFLGGLFVTESATVAIKPGCTLSRSAINVAAGATLEVAQSGTVALSNNLTLEDGATLGFNFTERRTLPMLDVTGRTVTLGKNGTVVVKISAEGSMRPHGGANVLTSGGGFAGANVRLAEGYPDWVKGLSIVDGEIVLDAKVSGMTLVVR